MSLKLSLIALSLLLLSADAAEREAKQLIPASEIKLAYGEIAPSALQAGLDKWSHGGLIHVGMDVGEPSVYTFYRDGTLLAGYDFKIPEAVRIQIDGFDRAADGSVALCGIANDAQGRASYFISRISPDGKDTEITRTNPYWPFVLGLAPDGTVWTVGVEQPTFPDGSSAGINPKGNVLRHYDQHGQLLFSTGPASDFDRPRLSSGFLVAAADRVAWYSPAFGRGVYAEYSPDGRAIGQYPGPPIPLDRIRRTSGFAYNESGAACLTLEARNPHTRILYCLDRARREWVPTEMPHPGQPYGPVLWGSDGDLFVFSGRSAEPDQSTARFFAVKQ